MSGSVHTVVEIRKNRFFFALITAASNITFFEINAMLPFKTGYNWIILLKRVIQYFGTEYCNTRLVKSIKCSCIYLTCMRCYCHHVCKFSE